MIINLSFKTGIFPDTLKIARITPIFKKGDKRLLGNYRPIASLPYISKVFERAMSNRLFSFLKKFSLLSKYQFGFQKGKSTCDALVNISELLYRSLNDKKHALSIFGGLFEGF